MNSSNQLKINPRFTIHSLLGEGGFGFQFILQYNNEIKEVYALKLKAQLKHLLYQLNLKMT